MRGKSLVVAMLAACGGFSDKAAPAGAADATPPADAGPPPTVELGSSDIEFVPLVDGGTISLVMGLQGGFHVFLTLRAANLSPGTRSETARACADIGTFQNPCVDFDVFDEDTQKPLDSFAPLRLPLTETAPGQYDLLPPRLVQLAVHSFDELAGHHVRVRATVDDALGRHADATLSLICMPATQ